MSSGRTSCRDGITRCGSKRLQRGLGRPDGDALELREFAPDPVRPEVAEDVDLSPPRGFGARVGQVDDDALVDPVDRGVRRLDEAFQALRQPVIAPRLAALAVHALLDDDPMAIVGDDEAVQVEIEAVLDGGAVDLGDEAARGRQRRPVEADPLPDGDELLRRLARMGSSAAADMQAEFARQRRQPALQRADDRGRDAGRMPVHPHDRAEGLEPERMSNSAQKLVAPVFEHDRFGDHGAEPGHALTEPSWHAAAVQRQIGAPSAAGHQEAPEGPDEAGARFLVLKVISPRNCRHYKAARTLHKPSSRFATARTIPARSTRIFRERFAALSVSSKISRSLGERSGATDNWRLSLSWGLIVSGALAAALLALGLNTVAPLGGGLDTLCDLAGVASGMLFIGLADGV